MRLGTNLELLKGSPDDGAGAINSDADTLLWNYGVLYRDDWATYGKYVDINKLILGAAEDEATWFSTTRIGWDLMNDRGVAADAGQIAGRWISPDGSIIRGFMLTPIPAP